MRVPNDTWSDALIEQLRILHATGASFSAIAAELGNGITRNAALGKAARLGLEKRGQNPPKPARAPKLRVRKWRAGELVWGRVRPPVTPQPLPAPALILGGPGVALLDLSGHHCRWPVEGDGAATLFCGGAKLEGHPYCEGHCRMAYVRRAA